MTMAKPTRSRRPLTDEEKDSLRKTLAMVNRSVSKMAAPIVEEIETGLGTSIDFDTLARVMLKLRADYLQGDIADQVAAFEREVVAMELNPSPRDFQRVKYAMEHLGVFARVIEGREWTPGREDLTPLFEMDELTAS
jgi:hypothetical protein